MIISPIKREAKSKPRTQASLRKRASEQFHFLLVSLSLKLYCNECANKQRDFVRVRA